MYTNYWHLRTTPFLNVIDRKLLFPAEQHEEAIARYTFLAESGRLAGTLTGPYGVGKSTVLKHVVAEVELRTKIPVIRMDAIPDGYLPMAQQILSMMGIDGPNQTFPDALMAFWYAAERHPESVQRTLLCIDDANYLGTESCRRGIRHPLRVRIGDA
ncbi:MAG: AAA family ATPase [Kiritimatiellae bacterium]|nr:AAA family ATPase [Kiritimatiellia bacterium]